jgi:hypothetical protein
MKSSPIFSKAQDLLEWLVPLCSKFPKEQRFRLAARLENAAFGFYEQIVMATRFAHPTQSLIKADIELQKLRLYLRLSEKMRCINFAQYEHGCRLCDEIGNLLGGWLDKMEKMPQKRYN